MWEDLMNQIKISNKYHGGNNAEISSDTGM